MSQLDKIRELVELREKARMGGGAKAIEKQHEKGKYTARERIDMLLFNGLLATAQTGLLAQLYEFSDFI